MSMTDPVADMLTRIRNAQQHKLYTTLIPKSKLAIGVLEVLKTEGFIESFAEDKAEDGHAVLKVTLRYAEGESVIKIIKRVSKPGRRVYSKIKDLKKFYNGLGMFIISTPQGVMSDYEARRRNLGGEVLCAVF